LKKKRDEKNENPDKNRLKNPKYEKRKTGEMLPKTGPGLLGASR
jgi:hypothetical protein